MANSAAIGLPVNLTGLELREVRSHIEMDGARKVLAVEGEIANTRRESRSVPPVALTVNAPYPSCQANPRD